MDGWVAVGWAGVNVLLLGALWRLCRRWFPHDTAAQTGNQTLVLFWAAITLAGFALGGLHLLSGGGVVGAGVVLVALSFGVLHCTAGRETSAKAAAADEGYRLAALGWLAVLSFWATRVLLEGLSAFPTDWDSLMYHVPLIDHWLQAGSLHVPDCPVWYNASTNELLGLWIVAPFSGDFLVALNNVPACLLLALSALELARGLGIHSPFDHLTAVAVTATQVFGKQLIDNENDVAVAALFLACTTYGLRYILSRASADLALGAISLGLLAGIKYYAVGYVVVAWTGLSLCAWLRNGGRHSLRMVLAGTLGVVVFSGYWYGRNVWLTGTPFFPLNVTRGPDALSTIYPHTWRSTFLGSGRPEVVPLAVAAVWKMAGPVHALALLAVPATLGWLVATGLLLRRSRDGGMKGAGRWLLAFLTTGAGAVLLVTPWAVETEPGTLDQLHWGYLPVRFGQCFLGLAVLALGMVLSDLSQGLHRFAAWLQAATVSPTGAFREVARLISRWCPLFPAVLFAGLIGWQGARVLRNPFFVSRYGGLDVALVTLDVMAAGWFLSRFRTPHAFRRGATVLASVAASVALAWGVDVLARDWHDGFVRHYNALFSTRVFTNLARCDPLTTRLCALDYRYYPFFGSRRQYSLCRPMKAFSYAWLVAYLQEQRANVVACMVNDPHAYGRYRGASAWVRGHPEVFTAAHEDRRFVWADVDTGRLARAGQP